MVSLSDRSGAASSFDSARQFLIRIIAVHIVPCRNYAKTELKIVQTSLITRTLSMSAPRNDSHRYIWGGGFRVRGVASLRPHWPRLWLWHCCHSSYHRLFFITFLVITVILVEIATSVLAFVAPTAIADFRMTTFLVGATPTYPKLTFFRLTLNQLFTICWPAIEYIQTSQFRSKFYRQNVVRKSPLLALINCHRRRHRRQQVSVQHLLVIGQ